MHLSDQYKVPSIMNTLKSFLEFVSKYALWLLLYITPIHPFFVTISILLFFDLVTGITKAVKNSERITSRRMRDTIIKLVFYSIAVFISFQVDKTLISDSSLVLTKIVGGYIMLIEFQSNIENISEITGVNIWMAVKDKIVSYFNSKTKDNEKL